MLWREKRACQQLLAQCICRGSSLQHLIDILTWLVLDAAAFNRLSLMTTNRCNHASTGLSWYCRRRDRRASRDTFSSTIVTKIFKWARYRAKRQLNLCVILSVDQASDATPGPTFQSIGMLEFMSIWIFLMQALHKTSEVLDWVYWHACFHRWRAPTTRHIPLSL